jgi:cytoskeletal protein RodZ
MKSGNPSYRLIHRLSAIIMLVTLTWLTVSIPFVYKAQEEIARQDKIQVPVSQDEDQAESNDNPFANTTEEKSGSTVTPTEEFLHDHHHEMKHHFTEISAQLIHLHESTYLAFHGEMLCPPPNA